MQNNTIFNHTPSEEEQENQTARSYIRTVISVLILTIATVLSSGIPNPVFRLLFIFFCAAGIFSFLFFPDQSGIKKIVLLCTFGTAAVALLLLSTIGAKIKFKEYMANIGRFLGSDSLYEEIETDLAAASDGLASLSQNMSLYRFWEEQKDPEEVQKILENIQKHKDEWDHNPFPDIETNRDQVELMYKMWFCGNPYHYYNILSALESLGIDCEKFDIDEYQLALWDTEMLFMYFNMRKSLETELADDPFHESWNGSFNDFKIRMDNYSDFFDYQGWLQPYKYVKTSDIMESLDDIIELFYEKFYINFRNDLN